MKQIKINIPFYRLRYLLIQAKLILPSKKEMKMLTFIIEPTELKRIKQTCACSLNPRYLNNGESLTFGPNNVFSSKPIEELCK